MMVSSRIYSDDWGALMLRRFRFLQAMAGLLLAIALTGCAVTGPATSSSPQASATPTVSTPPSLSDDELYALAVSQYEKLYAIITEVERQGGAAVLPDASRDVMMDPAWSAYNDLYVQVLLNGNRFIGEPRYSIQSIARLDNEKLIDGTVIALQTCELFEGASVVDKSGNTINDGSPVTMHKKAYFKYSDADGQLKVFVLNREVVDTCRI